MAIGNLSYSKITDRLQNAINQAIPVAMSGVALEDVKLDNEALVLRSGR